MTPGLNDDEASSLGKLVDHFPEARELGERFVKAGHELYLVGGTVRDALLAQSALAEGDLSAFTKIDLDFATSARPEQTEAILRSWGDAVWLTGAAFGTVSAKKNDRDVEITTFRSEVYEPGSRHPEVAYGSTIEGDLARRDFTVNAMAVRVPDFAFVDLFGGIGDLHRRVLRTPVTPEQSFSDDPLRMVRLARFASRLQAAPDDATMAAATAMAAQLDTISAERVRDELVKLLTGADPSRGIDLLLDTGLAQWVIPELGELAACVDPIHRHKDVYAHTLAVIDNVIALETDGPDPVLRLAALMHDIAKPETRVIHDDGKVTFHHHEMAGMRVTKRRLKALKFDNNFVTDVSELVKLHLRFHTYKEGWTDSAVRRYVTDAGPLLDRLNILTRADVTTRNKRKANAISRRMDELEERIAVLREQEELDSMRPAIDGNDIMAHLGLGPGRDVGEAWKHLLELRLDRGPMEPDEALAALDQWWAQRQTPAAPAADEQALAAVEGSVEASA
ncbi:MAG: poly(A) polymerase [Glaciecola sp.]|jgi:poly(A) polymerase